jgi:tRNA (guanosine-2'-O-)-methyltransferase
VLGPDSPLIGRGDLPTPVPPHALDALITPARARKYRQVLARRTGRLVVVVEDCYDPHNATAIVRTCDAFGVQRVLVSTGRNAFKVNRKVSQGSHHYIDLQVHPDITAVYAALRAEGFAIFASDLAADAVVGPQQLAPRLAQQPLALVFGNEGSGVSADAARLADGCFLIPMVGFPQSLNLSVSVATTLYALRHAALEGDLPGDLSAERQAALYEHWVRRHTGQAGEELLRRAALEVDKHGDETEVYKG